MEKGMELLMVTVSGQDRPGITSAMSRIMVDHDVEIVDIEQASLQDLLALTFLLDFSRSTASQDGVMKDLLFEGSRLSLNVNFRLYSRSEVKWIGKRKLYVLSFFGGTRALAELSTILGQENVNIETITSLTQHAAKCIEMIVNVENLENISRVKQKLMARSHELNVDMAFQKIEAYRKNKRMIVFDMDSTLVDMEIIDEMARKAGVYAEVARVTEKAMRGEFDFEESLRQRVALLKGLETNDLIEIRDNIRLSEGVREVALTLRNLGYVLGVVTGGFDFFADHLKKILNFDFAYANKLEIKDDVLTGRVLGTVVDAAQKARILNQAAREKGIMLDQTVAVGDGANDALMLGQAGLGLSYNAKSDLNRVASSSIGRSRLMNVLYLLGITEEDISEANRHQQS